MAGRLLLFLAALSLLLAACAAPQPPPAAELPSRCRHRIVDAHSQVDFLEFEEVIRSLNESCIAAAFLATRGRVTNRDVLEAARRWPGRILPMYRTKGTPWNEGRPQFFPGLGRALKGGQFLAYGELLVLHQEKGSPGGRAHAPRVEHAPNGPWVVRAVDAIASKGFPVHVHLELGLERDKIPPFERLLRSRPQVEFILGHRGWLDAGELARLLRSHPNLYTHMGWTAAQAQQKTHFAGYGEVFEGARLKAEWARLMNAMPDRFLYAQDNVFHFHWPDAPKAAGLWERNFRFLAPEALRLFTHGNAERLFKMPSGTGR